MSQKWNLQDIRPAEPRKRRVIAQEQKSLDISGSQAPLSQGSPRERIPNIVIEDGRKKGRHRLIISIILFVVIIGGAISLSATLGKTELTIYPKNANPNVSAEFTAYPDKRAGELSYEIMTLESTGESQVKASGQVEVQEQATGEIEISKNTPGAERLIKNTRFRTPEGLIYRIQESVVIPGAVKDENGQLVSGSIRAKVFADTVGEKFNIPSGVTMDVPGFQESNLSELYKAITAKSVVAFTGGFSGPQFQIDDTELSTARQALQIKLRDDLLLRITNEKPADYIAFPGAVAISYNQLPAVEYGNDLVTIREQAILQIPVFKETDLGSFLAEKTIATYDDNPVIVKDTSALTFEYINATTSQGVIANEPSLSFKLTGKPLLVWQFNVEKLKMDLAGLPKTALSNALPAYPGIKEARAHITPFWQQNFPDNAQEIIIVEELKTSESN